MPAAKRTTPSTGAERQRAYRQRHKGEIALPAVDLATAAAAEQDEISLPELNARMRRMAMQAFDEAGGVAYLRRVASKNANTFLRFVGQFVTKEDTINPGAFNIYVQTLTIENAQPVAGVIASPIAGHVSNEPHWLVPPVAGVIEEDPDA